MFGQRRLQRGAHFWSNPKMTLLEEQASGTDVRRASYRARPARRRHVFPLLRADAKYQSLLSWPFQTIRTSFIINNVTKAIASFERSIISARSPYDRYHYLREDDAVPDVAKRGEILFFNQHLLCFSATVVSTSRCDFFGVGAPAAAPSFTIRVLPPPGVLVASCAERRHL